MASRFERYVAPVLEALEALGGSARPPEVQDWIAKSLTISDLERSIENKNGVNRFANDVAWARFYLVRAGFIDSSRFGVWSITEEGRRARPLSAQAVSETIRRVRTDAKRLDESESDEASAPEASATATPVAIAATSPTYREQLIAILRELPPEGFERLCQRLLRESGFQQVTVTGRSGDGGIDGIGILQINPFVSFKVLFQSKRYVGTVGSEKIRDFRGAMMGRADKGLVLTTGTFSADAKAEAVRDGVPPIELVDGDGFISLLESLELGLVPIRSFAIEERFFDEFRSIPRKS